jgi:hypothetical protein
MISKLRVVGLLLANLIILAACVQTGSVKEFTRTSLNATRQMNKVTSDYESSCGRVNKIRPKKSKIRCEPSKQAARAVRELTQVLVIYLESLQQVSGDDTAKLNQSTRKLAKTLKASPLLTQSKQFRSGVDASRKLLDLVLNAGVESYKQKQLRKYMRQADVPFQTVTQSITKTVDKNYRLALEIEQQTVEWDLRIKQRRHKRKEPLAWQLYQESRQKKLNQIRGKKGALTRLVKTLRQMAEVHATLVTDSEKLGDKELLQIVKRYAKQTRDVIKEFNKL